MNWTLLLGALPILAYFLGAIPFGYLVAKSRGIDIFEHGSKNIGATNVARVLGRPLGVVVFMLDFLKGALPTAMAWALQPLTRAAGWPAGSLEVLTGAAAFLGHLFPIYLRFRGGKGVATGAGVVAVLLPIPALTAFVVWCVTALASRWVSLSSILAALVLAIVQIVLQPRLNILDLRTWFALGAALIVVVKHRTNLQRLYAGTESQIADSPVLFDLTKGLHTLCVATWFGSAIFFSFVTALSLFSTMETLGTQPKRPEWFPRPELYSKIDDAIDGSKEQGSRLAGHVISPLFLWYFALQGVCGITALALAWSWQERTPLARWHHWRVRLLQLGLLMVVLGWPIEQHVSALRQPRNQATDAYLQATEPNLESARLAMRSARGQFGLWHFGSLVINWIAIGCVGGATLLLGQLPRYDDQ